MGFFDSALDDAVKIQAQIIRQVTLENSALHKELLECKKCKPNPIFAALTIIINKSKFIIMDQTLNENQFTLADLSLFDTVKQQPVPDAVFSNIVSASDDETVAIGSVVLAGTIFAKDVQLPDGTTLPAGSPTTADYVKIAGVAGPAGEPPTRNCNVVTKADVKYTDSLGNASRGSVVITVAVSVIAVQTADGVELLLRFSVAQVQF